MNLFFLFGILDIFVEKQCHNIMFALCNYSSFCVAASSKRTSSFNGRRRNECVSFVSKSKSGEDFVVDSETAKTSSFSSIQKTFSSPKASLVKACSISTSLLMFQADNAFAASADAEELKQFLIGFWNFRTGDVTSILLYTVAPIALPYLIFSQVICLMFISLTTNANGTCYALFFSSFSFNLSNNNLNTNNLVNETKAGKTD